MKSLASNQARQTLSYVAFAIVAVAGFLFWAVELHLSISIHQEREEEVLAAYQGHQLEVKAEEIRDLLQELYQTGRTISLLPALRGASGGNRKSLDENVVRQGRLSADTHRMLQQVYENLGANVRVSEIYFVLDGFDFERGEVPFFMYDNAITRRSPYRPDGSTYPDYPVEVEVQEYAEIRKQLAWFRENAPMFVYGARLNAIPALISPLIRTCDNTQYVSTRDGNQRDAAGFVYSIPVFDDQSGKFKGQVSSIVRANVFEAKLIGAPYLPITPDDKALMANEGWQMPPPAPFILIEKLRGIEIADRRNAMFKDGLAAALNKPEYGGRWASQVMPVPGQEPWQLHHHLSDAEVQDLVGGLRRVKLWSILGRIFLLVVLSSFLGWGFWLMQTSRRELIKMAHYDLLTDLPNRRLFFDRMNSGLVRARRNNTKLGLVFVDLAGLNAINDRHGHHGGDVMLVKMARRLLDALRLSEDLAKGRSPGVAVGLREATARSRFMLCRLGGDEFTVLAEDLHSADDLVLIVDRIVECVRQPFELGSDIIEVTLNVGAALFPDDAEDAERLLMAADSAMHECKATNSNYVLFNEDMRQRAARHHLLTLELVTALQKDQFRLYYQPKATLLDGTVVSMEALIRWNHPTMGLISPIEFVPILERNGDIVEVGQWIVEQACRDFDGLSDAGFSDVRLSINVSVRQLKRADFCRFLETTLKSNGIAAKRLILEITETMVMEDLTKGREILLALKQLGVSLALDDFGAGYSSLTYLQQLPLDSLKIDKSLIDGMVDAHSIHVVESVISLARGLSLKTIAEGVETEEQRALIAGLGCDMIQGYLLSRPLPLPEIIEWLRQRQSGGASSNA